MTSYIQHVGGTVYSFPAFEIKEIQTRDGCTQYAIYQSGRCKGIFPTLYAAKHSIACSIKYSKSAKGG